MKIRILGCGPSYGIPSLRLRYGRCNPQVKENMRTRSSILIQTEHQNIVIDTGPEIRLQLIGAGYPWVDAVVYTHAHYDHMAGANEMRAFMVEDKPVFPVYLSKENLKDFNSLVGYALKIPEFPCGFEPHIIKPYEKFKIGKMEFLPIEQVHGKAQSIGYRIGDFAYSTDFNELDEKAFKALEGIKTWILGVGTETQRNPAVHLNLEKALQCIERIKPEKVVMTHLGEELDYNELCQVLPEHIRPAYDGLEIEV